MTDEEKQHPAAAPEQPELREIPKEELDRILKAHRKWVESERATRVNAQTLGLLPCMVLT